MIDRDGEGHRIGRKHIRTLMRKMGQLPAR